MIPDRDMLQRLPWELRVEIEENIVRKDFTQSELAAWQQRLIEEFSKPENKRQGQRTCTDESSTSGHRQNSTERVGKLFGESERTVRKRLAIVEAAEAEPQRFQSLVEEMDETGNIDRAFRGLKLARARDENARRSSHGGSIADLHQLVASGYRAQAILADPPWPFATYSDAGKDRSADQHYGTLSLDAIKALPIASLAADDCVLFLWVTWPALLQGAEVIAAWGFSYSTAAFVWVKENRSGEGLFTGLGYWTRSNSEPCLLATCGNPSRLSMDIHQVVEAPVGAHSAKPDETHARIERLVGGPYLELFARRLRPGWMCWGDEIPPPSLAEALVAAAE